MADEHDNTGVLFVDVSDSSRLYREYGDIQAKSLIEQCLNLLRNIVRNYGGTVIKEIGDELFCTFPDADRTVQAAMTMQTEVRAATRGGRLEPDLSVRIGLHVGPVIVEDEDVFGDTVYLAKRMVNLAKGEQILVTREAAAAARCCPDDVFRLMDRELIKGRREVLDVLEVVWDAADATHAMIAVESVPEASASLWLDGCGKSLILDRNSPTVALGRHETCSFAVLRQDVSRFHASIEYGKDAFLLRDMSTNGTYVRDAEGKVAFARRGELRLSGTGVISLGCAPDDRDEFLIRFRVRAPAGSSPAPDDKPA